MSHTLAENANWKQAIKFLELFESSYPAGELSFRGIKRESREVIHRHTSWREHEFSENEFIILSSFIFNVDVITHLKTISW